MTDQEINEAVARKLGWIYNVHPYQYWIPPDLVTRDKHGDRPSGVPAYCTSIAAAWEIVEWLNKHDYEVELTMNPDGPDTLIQIDKKAKAKIAECDFTGDPIKDFACLSADTAPMAICLAFLKLP